MQTKSPLRDMPDVLLNYALAVSQQFRLHLYDGGLYAVALDGTMMLDVMADLSLYAVALDTEAYGDLELEQLDNARNALGGIEGDWCWNGDELPAAPGLEVLVHFPEPVRVN